MAIFISFLFKKKGNSLSITSITILIFLWPIFAGTVTEFSELNNFPSSNLRPLLVESLVFVIFVIFLMPYAVLIIILDIIDTQESPRGNEKL